MIKNCSSTRARHSFALKYSYANGNVIYHYTSTDPKYGSDFHMYLSMSNLIDNEELNGDFVETHVRPYGGTDGNRHGVTSSQTVFWNTKGNRYKSGTNYIIDSRQHGYGYIIGTQGAAINVKTTPTSESSTYGTPDTAPEDYKEGIGQAATLSPQSLYYDQLERRLNGGTTATVNDIPGTFSATDFSSASSGITSNTTEGGIKYVGNLSAGSSLEYKVNAKNSGKYRLTVNAVAGNSNTNRVLSVYSEDTLITTLNVPNKTDWFAFEPLTAEIDLPNIGEHTIKITSTGSANISDIKFEKVNERIPGKVSVGAYSSKTDSITINKVGNTLYAGNVNPTDVQPTTGNTNPTKEQESTTANDNPTTVQRPTTEGNNPTSTQQTTTANDNPTSVQQTTTATVNPTTAIQPTTATVNPTEAQQPTEESADANSEAKKTEKKILSLKNDKDPKGTTFGKLRANVKKNTKNSNKIAWKKQSGADKYVIYGAKCGTSYKKIAEVKGTSYTHKGLQKGTYYKYMVVAQDEDGNVLAISKLMHAATKGGKVGNCKSLKVNQKKVALKKGQSFKAKVKQIAAVKGVKIKNHRKIAFESSNTKVATVSKKGVIKAKKKGKCTVWVYAQNGVYTKISVSVKSIDD